MWLQREEGSDSRRQGSAWWHRHRLSPARTMTFTHPDAVKRAVMAGLGVAMVSKLTVEDDLESKRLATVRLTASLPSRPFIVVDHPQKHHGAACRAMLELFDRTFPPHRAAPPRARESRKTAE
jgi:DNA-binding transcriptional LysR family regulator